MAKRDEIDWLIWLVTVVGSEPRNPSFEMYKILEWDKLPINLLVGFLPSTVCARGVFKKVKHLKPSATVRFHPFRYQAPKLTFGVIFTLLAA